MITKHLKLKRIYNLSTYQKLSVGSWRNAKDPSIYGWHDINYEKARLLSEKLKREKQIKLTPTYLMAQAASVIFTALPRFNTLLRGGLLYQREKLNFSFLVALPSSPSEAGGSNLSSCVVRDINKLNLIQLYQVLQKQIQKTQNQKEEVVKTQNYLMRKIPAPFMRFFLDLSSFLLYTLNIRFRGIPEDPFGSLMISNVGGLGIDNAFIPLVPYTRVPVFMAIGLLKPRPVVTREQKITVQNQLRIHYTIDHRYIEGKSLALMEKMMFFIFDNPQKWLLPAPLVQKKEFEKAFYSSLPSSF